MLEKDVNDLAELDEDILTSDVPDDALERAAPVADRRIITLYCTRDPLSCGWPVQSMSAFGGKADIRRMSPNVR